MDPETETASRPVSDAGPTWYDVLGLDQTASTEEVRDAWRAATDRAEPGSGRFRSCNQAAETLLDPDRRAAYDADLAARAQEAEQQRVDDLPAVGGAEPREDPKAADRKPVGPLVALLGGWPTWLMALLLVLVLGLVAAGVVLARDVSATARVADAQTQAPVAAERAAEAILSYDYEDLPADRARAEPLLTGDFKESYLENFALLEEQPDGGEGVAVQTQAVVTAQVLRSGVVGVGDDGRTARVLVFVNQTSEKQGTDPQVFQNRVVMTMTQDDDRWLVSDLRSY